MVLDKRLQQIKEILEQRRGKSQQISAGEIGLQVGIDEDATHAKARDLILQTIKEFKLPVAASNRGYYLIDNEDELQEYCNGIDGRISEMTNRKDLVQKNYKNRK